MNTLWASISGEYLTNVYSTFHKVNPSYNLCVNIYASIAKSVDDYSEINRNLSI